MENLPISLEELQQQLDQYFKQRNSAPLEDFDQLSPDQMNFLLYQVFESGSPIGYRETLSQSTLNQIPFFRLFCEFLQIIEEAGELKLTKTGNLPRKIIHALYNTGIIKEYDIESGLTKLMSENDSIVLKSIKYVGILSGILKKRDNKLSFTQKGGKYYHAEFQVDLFKKMFETHIFKFNLGMFDGYPETSILQNILGYTLYLLLKYGQQPRPPKFYIQKSIRAFPQQLAYFPERHESSERPIVRCFNIRIIQRCLLYYGWLETEPDQYSWDPPIGIKTTQLFHQTFEIKH